MKSWKDLFKQEPSREFTERVMSAVDKELTVHRQSRISRGWFVRIAALGAMGLAAAAFFMRQTSETMTESEMQLDLAEFAVEEDLLNEEWLDDLDDLELIEELDELEKG